MIAALPTTGSVEGIVTKGGLVLVTGCNIKLNAENADAIFFINNEGEVTTLNMPLEKNESGQLIFRIPFSLKAGEYIFQIRKSFLIYLNWWLKSRE